MSPYEHFITILKPGGQSGDQEKELVKRLKPLQPNRIEFFLLFRCRRRSTSFSKVASITTRWRWKTMRPTRTRTLPGNFIAKHAHK